jgi:hypothetical protein
VKEGDNVNVDGLSAYLNGKIAAVSGDTNDYVTGGSVNNETGIITLEISGGKGSASVTGLNEYINGKTSGFSTTDIQVNSGSVNATNGVITLTRTDSKNPSSTVSPVTIDGLAAYVSSVTPADVWVNTSGDTMTGSLGFSGNSKIYVTGVTAPQDPRDDYSFIQGVSGRSSLDEFLLPSGGTANSGKIAMVNSSGEWNLRAPNDIWVTLNTDQTIDGGKTFENRTTFNDDIYINGLVNAQGFSIDGLSNADNYVLLAGGNFMPLSGITPADVWVNETGDTMTGTLTIASKSGNKQNALEVNGDVSVSGNVSATGAMYSSDKRLKENIKFIPGDDLENAKKIDFKEFNFIADKGSQKVGVIAQELKENGLGKFTKQNDAGYLTVDYISLLCLKIAQLEKEIKELKEGK